MSANLRTALKPLAAKLGLQTSAVLWERFALAQYSKKVKNNPAYAAWLGQNNSWIKGHWSHYEMEGSVGVAHLSSQLFEITEQLRKRIGLLGNETVLDAGASDGMFLKLVGAKKGTGVNILPACVEKIRLDGYDAVQSSLETLPFKDKSFDFVICCETLEHVLNPLLTLNELARVCRKKIYLTIPWVERTTLHSKPAGWPETESHIFEFSEPDFAKVITFSDVSISYKDIIRVFPEPFNPLLRAWIGYWMYPSFFPKLQYYELIPNERTTS